MHPRNAKFSPHGLRTAALVSLALCVLACAGSREVERTEQAMQFYVDGMQARSEGDPATARVFLEQACQLGHEPSCQEVWLRVDMEIASGAGPMRDALEITARHMAVVTDGVYFLYEDPSAVVARVYCPVGSHQELSDLLSEFQGDTNG